MKSYQLIITASAEVLTGTGSGEVPVDPVATAWRNADPGDLNKDPTCSACGRKATLRGAAIVLVKNCPTQEQAVRRITAALNDGTINLGDFVLERIRPERMFIGEGGDLIRAGSSADKVLYGQPMEADA